MNQNNTKHIPIAIIEINAPLSGKYLPRKVIRQKDTAQIKGSAQTKFVSKFNNYI